MRILWYYLLFLFQFIVATSYRFLTFVCFSFFSCLSLPSATFFGSIEKTFWGSSKMIRLNAKGLITKIIPPMNKVKFQKMHPLEHTAFIDVCQYKRF